MLGLAGCGFGGEEKLVQRNQGVRVQNHCKIQPLSYSGSDKAKMPDFQPETQAIDTDGDGRYDEAFVVRDYMNMNMSSLPVDSVARATTHYVAPGLGPDRQYLTGFPDTKPMTPEYQAALGLVCRGQ